VGSLLQAVRGLLGGGASKSDTPQGGGNSGGSGTGSGVDEDKTLQFTRDKWSDRKNAFVVYHQSIWQALLFYANQSWIDWDDARKVWQPQQPTDEWVPRPRINRFAPAMDSVASNFFQLPPIEAAPKAEKQSDPQSHAIADICSDLVAYVIQKDGLEHQQGEEEDKVGLAAQLYVLEGTIFSHLRVRKKSLGTQPAQAMQPAWGAQCESCDNYTSVPATGEKPQFCTQCGAPLTITDTESLQPQLGDDGQPQQNEILEYEVECEIGNALYAFPRPGSTSLADSQDLLWAQRRTLDEIWFRWNFEAEPDSEWPDGYSVTYEHALNFWYTGYSSTTLQVKDSCMVLEEYVAPGKVKDFPEGFHNVVINQRQAFVEKWDFPEHPLTMGKYLTFPTLFFGRAISFDCVEIQREDNAYESLKKLHGMVSAVDPWVVDADSLVTDITGRADKIIKYKRTSPDVEPPHRAGHGSLDEGIYKQGEILRSEYQSISGATKAFKGEAEYAGEPAAAAKLRRDQAELQFGKPAANWRNFWRETLRKYVKFLQKYYSVEQLAKILGSDRIEDIRSFKGADLDNTIDFLAANTGLPRTKTEIKEELTELEQMGALDVNDPSVRQRIYEVSGETGMLESFNEDATNARLENEAFKTGKGDPSLPGQYVPPQIKPMPGIEDLAVHLYFHKKQAKTRDFKRWNPAAQQALFAHIMETIQALAVIQGPPPADPAAPKPPAMPPQPGAAPGAMPAPAA